MSEEMKSLPNDVLRYPFALQKIANAMQSKVQRLDRLEQSGQLKNLDKDVLIHLLLISARDSALVLRNAARLQRKVLRDKQSG